VPQRLREVMTRYAGLERDAAGLAEALARIGQIERAGGHEPSLMNMTVTAKMVVAGALNRCESRGGHTRSDFPDSDPASKRTFMTLADAERIAAATEASLASPSRAAQ
jgi:L-aspartate oxidase